MQNLTYQTWKIRMHEMDHYEGDNDWIGLYLAILAFTHENGTIYTNKTRFAIQK